MTDRFTYDPQTSTHLHRRLFALSEKLAESDHAIYWSILDKCWIVVRADTGEHDKYESLDKIEQDQNLIGAFAPRGMEPTDAHLYIRFDHDELEWQWHIAHATLTMPVSGKPSPVNTGATTGTYADAILDARAWANAHGWLIVHISIHLDV